MAFPHRKTIFNGTKEDSVSVKKLTKLRQFKGQNLKVKLILKLDHFEDIIFLGRCHQSMF